MVLLRIGSYIRCHGLYSPQDHDLEELTEFSSTTVQGLLLFSRHDTTLLATIEKTGIFESMFSVSGKEAAYIIFETAEHVAALQYTHSRNKQSSASEQLHIRRMIKSLDAAIQLGRTAYPREAFLTATALSIQIYLGVILRCTITTEHDYGATAIELMRVLQKPEQQLCSSLALCSSLESTFWQAMMGAIAAPDITTRCFYTSRLERITVALALTSWQDGLAILQRIFWTPSIFAAPCCAILSEVLHQAPRRTGT